MKYIILIMFCCLSLLAQSQEALVDSLEELLTHPKDDYDEIDIRLGLARMYMLGAGSITKGSEHAEAAVIHAQEMESLKYEAMATTFVGMLKYNLSEEPCVTLKKAKDLGLSSGDPNAIAFTAYPWIEYCSYDVPENIRILEEIIAEYKDKLDRKHLGNLYKVIAYEYEKEGRFAAAENAYLEGMRIFQGMSADPSRDIDSQLGRHSYLVLDRGAGNLFQCNIYLGQLYDKMGRYDEGIASAQKALDASANVSDIGYASSQLASIYQSAGQYANAIELFNIAVVNYRSIDEPTFLSSTLSRLGSMYRVMGEYQEAENRFEEALDIAKDLPDDRAEIVLQLADIYEATSRQELAIEHYFLADSLFQAIGNQLSRIQCQLSIANVQSVQGNYELAIQSIQNQIDVIENTKDIVLLHGAYYKLARIEERRSAFGQAITYGQTSLGIAEASNNNMELLRQSHNLLSSLYEQVENYKEAFFHQQQSQAYKDSLYTDDAVQKLKEEQVRQHVDNYVEEKEQAEQVAALLSQQNKLYLALAGILLTLLGIGAYLFYQLRKTRVLLQSQNLQLQELNKTKDRFFGIIAHDIRSPILALESVDEQMDYYAGKGDMPKLKKLSSMVGGTARQLNSLLDNLLNWALIQTGNIPYRPKDSDVHEIAEETHALLSANANIKGIVLENNIALNQRAYVDPSALQTIFRNLVGNAIKFTPKGGSVSLESVQKDRDIIITITDTGTGMTTDQVNRLFEVDKQSHKGTSGERGTGLGMILVKELITLNKGTIQIESKLGEGTIATLTLPLQNLS